MSARTNDEGRSYEETDSVLDLPIDIRRKIFKYAGLKKGLRLRVNKAMDQRVHALLELKIIKLEIHHHKYVLIVDESATIINNEDIWGLCQLAQGLHRWSQNTFVPKIEVIFNHTTDDNIGASISHLAQFEADQLLVHTNSDSVVAESGRTMNRFIFKLPQLDFSTLLVMSANMREVKIDITCSSLEALDLCIFRKALLDGGCKLESFSVMVKEGVEEEFIKSCYHVIIKNDHFPNRTIEYQSAPTLNPVKLYSMYETFPTTQIHFERDLKTEIDEGRIRFNKITEDSDQLHNLHEIKLNHTYTYFFDFDNM